MTDLAIPTVEEVAVASYLVEWTVKSAVTGNSLFESLFSLQERNPHLDWKPAAHTIRGFQFMNVLLDGEFRGLFSSGRFIRGTGYLVPDEVMETIEVAGSRLVSVGTDETVIVGCNAAHSNYFHWVTQALPAMDCAVNRGDQSLRIQLALPRLNNWQEDSLRLLGLANVKRLAIEDPSKQYALARAEYNQILNGAAAFSNSMAARETYRRLRGSVELTSPRDKKLYIARTDSTSRQMRNEEALIDEVRSRGYEVTTPGNLSFLEQIRLFRCARLVVGAHGAGLTNIVFCEPGTIVYELVPAHYANACFCNLAHVCNLRYWQDAFVSEGSGPPNLRGWESDTPFVLQRLDEIERIDAEWQEKAKREGLSAMEFVRGGQTRAPGQPAKDGWMRRLFRAMLSR